MCVGGGGCVGSLFCNAFLGAFSSLAVILLRKRELVLFICVVAICGRRLFLMVPWGWSAVCDCVISWSYELT